MSSSFTNNLVPNKTLPRWGVFVLDCIIVLVSFLLVYLVNNGLFFTAFNIGKVFVTACFYLIFYVIAFLCLRTYLGIIRYSSFVDLLRVGSAVAIGMLCDIIAKYLLSHNDFLIPFRGKDLVMSAVFAMVAMWALRILTKYAYESVFKSRKGVPVFIYGVKQGGIGLAKNIRSQDGPYYVAGFISDGEDLPGHMLMGVRVYQNCDRIGEIIRQNGVRKLLVSPLKNNAIRHNQRMIDSLIAEGVTIYMSSSPEKWDGRSEVSQASLKEVDIEDLLPREQIEIDLTAVGNLLSGKSILITGAAGSIGSEIVRQVSSFNPARLILVDQAETPLHDIRLMMVRDFQNVEAYTIVADITQKDRMDALFKLYRPDYVFHAAAYKHVPMMEDNPGESIRNNVEGTRIIADLAVKYNTKKFVMVSTDKAVNPTNVMGCSKRICEIYVQSLDKAIKDGTRKGQTQFVTTRFGNVLGSNGSVIPLFKEQIRRGGPVTVTHPDIIRFFMLIPEACKLVLEAGTMGNGGEIFVFDMGNPVKIVDLAKRMIMLSGAKNVEIKFTGLRAGEKLYEEVLNKEETTKPTFNEKIKIATVREYDYGEVNRALDRLIQSSFGDDMEIVRQMKSLVPEFKSRHSKYEVLDATTGSM